MVDDGVEYGTALEPSETELFVEVVFANTRDEATGCAKMLKEHGISAKIEETVHDDSDLGISVLVPQLLLDEASELLANRAQDMGGGDEDFDEDDEADDDDDDDDVEDDYDDDDDDYDDDDDDEDEEFDDDQ